MKISASVYTHGPRSLTELVKELDECGIDCLHLDCNNDPAVFEDIALIRQISKLPLDLHIISPSPAKYFEAIRKFQVEMVTFQHEAIEGKFAIPADLPSEIGIAISAESELSVFDSYSARAKFILFTGSTPGLSGGRFNNQTFRRIREFSRRYPGKKIHVDGGVNDEVSFILRNIGVRTVVSGSYLVNSNSIARSLLQMQRPEVGSHYFVRDFMLLPDELPVINENQLSLPRVLHAIEDLGMGFAIVVNENQKLMGLVTNADIRRALLKHIDDLNAVTVGSLVNRNPKVVNEGLTVSEMLDLIKEINFPVLYMPVVNDSNQLTGAIKFNNLVKGES